MRAKFHARVILLFALLLVAQSFFGSLSWSTSIALNRIASPEGFHNVILADIVPHSSINISSNQDFVLQGWPGNGTEVNPYEIDGLRIDIAGCCINISNTDVFFIIQNCLLSSEYSWPGYCLSLTNATNGAITDCVIESHFRGVLLQSSKQCSIDECEINAGTWGVDIEFSSTCTISNSILTSNTVAILARSVSDLEVESNNVEISSFGGNGITLSNCNDFDAHNNTIHGDYSRGLSVHDSTVGVIANNSIIHDLYGSSCTGIQLGNVTNFEILSNDISQGLFGIYLGATLSCIVELNSIHDNDYGIWTQGVSDTYSMNRFSTNRYGNAEDAGYGNVWYRNWWDDYVGYGWYPILGSAGSFDTDPSPKNNVLLVGTAATISIILLSCFILITVGTRRMRRRTPINRESIDWDFKERFTLPLLITMLLPTDVFFYFPAYSPSRWLILGATPFGVISWTAYPAWGHHPLEFIFPLMGDFQISLYYALFGLLWFLLSAFVVRSFWLFAGGEIDRARMKRTVYSVTLVIFLLSLFTLTIPLPLTPLATLLQISRFSNAEGT